LRVLAVSHDLPPALYPQAIQIGRLLAHCAGEIGAVCGKTVGPQDLDIDFGLDQRLAFRLEVAFRPRLSNMSLALARRFVPLYARIPDEFRGWVLLAETRTIAQLAESRFRPDSSSPVASQCQTLCWGCDFELPWLAHFSDPWVDSAFRRRDRLANIVPRRPKRHLQRATSKRSRHARATVL
jgi:hypothetical protein